MLQTAESPAGGGQDNLDKTPNPVNLGVKLASERDVPLDAVNNINDLHQH